MSAITIDEDNRGAVMLGGRQIGRVRAQRFSQHGTRYWLYDAEGRVVGAPIMTRRKRADLNGRLAAAAQRLVAA